MTMGRPKKDPAAVRSIPLNFRVSPAVKGAIDVLSARHATETGDDSLTGWFIALVTREARAAGVPIGVAPEVPAVKVAKGKRAK
jgi:hypothetical protein